MIEDIAKALFEAQKQDKLPTGDAICREELLEFLRELRFAMFNNYFCGDWSLSNVTKSLQKSYEHIQSSLGDAFAKYQDKIDVFYQGLDELHRKLMLDVEALFEGDPAATDIEEIVSTYPGFLAIYCYRVAHEFYLMGMKRLARIVSEYAHSRTGVDINPGATIGDSFFIDHGTGIVIGETAEIGNHCKLYQGVTLGAISLRNGRKLSGKKRHPTLKDNVVIYSGASIFGGETILGNNVVVGSNVEIKESIPDNTVVRGNPGAQK